MHAPSIQHAPDGRPTSASYSSGARGLRKPTFQGVPPKGSQMSYDMSRLYSSEHSIIPSYAASEFETNEALKLIAVAFLDAEFRRVFRRDPD